MDSVVHNVASKAELHTLAATTHEIAFFTDWSDATPETYGSGIIVGGLDSSDARIFYRGYTKFYTGYFRANMPEIVWTEYATATPPAVYDLPLAAGFTAYVPCQYWKTQEGEVKTCCRIRFYNGIASPIRLFSLPEGYRPRNPMSVLTKVDVNGMQYFAHVDLGQNGDATMYMATNDSLGGEGIITMDQFVFVAA
ncbi:hypothetical protein RWV98_15860 [Agathobaculum sp. NTUH-O15-33]|uniref:hypothetical protein n=1 Tax=Agathobaculum sp. NTUH-O15-33 TaxID=3079302 RepID=UPI0029587F1F|nr:hypothetical protein [Agathobaculum sp. NTUH-O15-33]WNX84038.1 hypothetical protein RWV98_15860 [Agathobaculum sp. NTUH-O15-33]